MDIRTHWQAVEAHPMGGWWRVADPALPELDPFDQPEVEDGKKRTFQRLRL